MIDIDKLIKKIQNIHSRLYEDIVTHPYIMFYKIKYGKKYNLSYLYESLYYYISLLEELRFVKKTKILTDSDFLISSIIFCSIYEIFEKISQSLDIINFFDEIDISHNIKTSCCNFEIKEINEEFINNIGFLNKNRNKKDNWSIYFARQLRHKLVHFNGEAYEIWHVKGSDDDSNVFVFAPLLFEEKCLKAKNKLIISKNFYLLSLNSLIDYIQNNFYKLMTSKYFKIKKNFEYIKLDKDNKLEKIIKKEKLNLINSNISEELVDIFEFYNIEKTNKLLHNYVEFFLNLFRWYSFNNINKFDEIWNYKYKYNDKKRFFLKEPKDVFSEKTKIGKWIINKINSLKLKGNSLELKIAFYYDLLNFNDYEFITKLKDKMKEILSN